MPTVKEMEEALNEYSRVFGCCFPSFLVPDSDEFILKEIKKALRTGKPYEPEYKIFDENGNPIVY